MPRQWTRGKFPPLTIQICVTSLWRGLLSKAISHAIQGAGDSVPEQDERNTESETMDASPPPVSEGGTDTPLAVPERPLAEDHPVREAASPLPPDTRSASNDNEGDSIAP